MPSIDQGPVKMDYTQYMSLESKNRVRSQLKELRPYFDMEGMISFGAGYPHASTWPINGMTLSVPFARKSVFVPGYGNESPEGLLPLADYAGPKKTEPLRPHLANELQYSATYGHPHYVAWMKEHVQRLHNVPYSDWEIHATAGNTDGVDAIIRSCLDKGDSILVEEFAYPGTLTSALSIGLVPVGVPMDADGITPEALDQTLSEWNEKARGAARPKFLFLVPTCSNPTGVTMSKERKQEIYAISRKWGLIIVEDDPYCFLQIRENGKDTPIVPTFLSLDVDGRVLRVDSFSKIVAPGSRSGWITGPKPLVDKIMTSREGATQAPSGFSVAAISSVIRAWGGHEGYENEYLPHISSIYSERCLRFVGLLKKYLPEQAIELPKPSGGMFLWVRLRIESHPDFPSKSPEDIAKQVFLAGIDKLVLVVPSFYFKSPGGQTWTAEEEAKRTFLRLSFALPPPEEMEEGVKRLGEALKLEWKV